MQIFTNITIVCCYIIVPLVIVCYILLCSFCFLQYTIQCRTQKTQADLEPCGTPVNKLNGPLGLYASNGGIDILWNHVSTVQHTASHVLPVPRVALHHLIGWLKAGVGDFHDRQLLVVRLLGRDHRGVRDQGEVDARVRHQVGLELCQIDVERSVETQGGGDR